MIATSRLRSVGKHLTDRASRLSVIRAYAVERGIDLSDLDSPINKASEAQICGIPNCVYASDLRAIKNAK